MIKVDTPHKSSLQLKKLIFTDLKFRRNVEDVHDVVLKISTERKINCSDDCKNIDVTLTVKLFDDEDKMSMSVTAFASFFLECSEVLDSDGVDRIININTVSIMYPYIRSQVSLLTAQPELAPVIIPPLNINLLFDND